MSGAIGGACDGLRRALLEAAIAPTKETYFKKQIEVGPSTQEFTCRDCTSSQDSVLLLFLPVSDPTIDFKAAPKLLPGVCRLDWLLPSPCGWASKHFWYLN